MVLISEPWNKKCTHGGFVQNTHSIWTWAAIRIKEFLSSLQTHWWEPEHPNAEIVSSVSDWFCPAETIHIHTHILTRVHVYLTTLCPFQKLASFITIAAVVISARRLFFRHHKMLYKINHSVFHQCGRMYVDFVRNSIYLRPLLSAFSHSIHSFLTAQLHALRFCCNRRSEFGFQIKMC